MKTVCTLLAVAIFLGVTPNPCFALWDLIVVSKEQAKVLGMEVRTTATGPKHVSVALEFKTEGNLKNFSTVAMSIGKGDNFVVSAPLQPDRSKPGRVVVGLTVDRGQLDKLS